MHIIKLHLLIFFIFNVFDNNIFSQKVLKKSITDSSSIKEVDGCILKVENSPTFSGGPKALEATLNKKMHYPIDAIKTNYGGKVVIQFCIDKDGAIQEPKILQGACLYYDLSKEALRLVVNIPKWKPGEQNGRKVIYRYFIDLDFSIKEQIPTLVIDLHLKYNGQYGQPDSSCNKILFW